MYPTVHKVRDTGGSFFQHRARHSPRSSAARMDTAAFVGASVLKKRFGFDQDLRSTTTKCRSPPTRRPGRNIRAPRRRVVERSIRWLAHSRATVLPLGARVRPAYPYDPPRHSARIRGQIVRRRGRLHGPADRPLTRRRGRKSGPETTLIAVLSDHGESFSEHGEYTHGVFLYDTTSESRSSSRGPASRGMRVKEQARSIDLLPTLVELLGGRAPRIHRRESRSGVRR